MTEATAHGDRSVAVTHNSGIISTGDYATNTLITLPDGLPSAQHTPAPPRTVRLGTGRGKAVFVGREAELARLTSGSGGAQVVVGLGGCGKSTLAEVFSRLRCAQDNPVWWIDARTEQRIQTGLAELAGRLDPALAPMPIPVAAAWARDWLAAHEGWLVVLDDLPGPKAAEPLLQQLPHGRFLMTSRHGGAGWSEIADVVRLGELDGAQAVALLEELIRRQSADSAAPDLTGAAELCERLGRLPLAIEHAGAFIALDVSSPKRYLELLDADSAQLLNVPATDGDPARSVARTWRVTFDRLVGDVHALDTMRILAWFAPDGIPRVRGLSGPAAVESSATMTQLAAYHLVTLTSETMSVHPLVQEILRTPDDSDPHRSAAATDHARQTAITLMRLLGAARLISLDPAEWPARRRLFPHIETVLANSAPERDDEGLLVLARWLGQSLYAQGDFRGALRHLTRCAESLTRLFGADDLRTLEVRVPLAQSFQALGDLEAAARIYRDAFERAARSLGPAHETTLVARMGVAAILTAEGEPDAAIEHLNAVLAISVEQYGAGNPFAAVAENNLAAALSEAGRLDEALGGAEAHFQACLERFGPDHADTLRAQHNLATSLLRSGELDQSISMLEDVVDRKTRLLGEDHPETLKSLGNLSAGVIESRDLVRARELIVRTLELRERTLGPEHPDTRDSHEALRMLDELTDAITADTAAAGTADPTADPRRRGLLSLLRRRPDRRP